LLVSLLLPGEHGATLVALLLIQNSSYFSVIPPPAIEQTGDQRYQVYAHHDGDGNANWRGPAKATCWL
jgi:hypothetical protein